MISMKWRSPLWLAQIRGTIILGLQADVDGYPTKSKTRLAKRVAEFAMQLWLKDSYLVTIKSKQNFRKIRQSAQDGCHNGLGSIHFGTRQSIKRCETN